jgi:hypothetical protein
LRSAEYRKANPGIPVWAGDPDEVEEAPSPGKGSAGGTKTKKPCPSKPRRSRLPVARLSPAVTLRQRPKEKLGNGQPRGPCNLSGNGAFDDEEPEDVEEVERMTVEELKAELKARKASTAGVKADLVDRLLELRSTDEEKKEESEEEEEPELSRTKSSARKRCMALTATKGSASGGGKKSRPSVNPPEQLWDRLFEQQKEIMQRLERLEVRRASKAGGGASRTPREDPREEVEDMAGSDDGLVEDLLEDELEMQRLLDANARYRRRLRLRRYHSGHTR